MENRQGMKHEVKFMLENFDDVEASITLIGKIGQWRHLLESLSATPPKFTEIHDFRIAIEGMIREAERRFGALSEPHKGEGFQPRRS